MMMREEEEPIYGKGGKIRGYGTGNQKNSVKISLLREDFNEMCRVIQSKGYKNFYKYVIEDCSELCRQKELQPVRMS